LLPNQYQIVKDLLEENGKLVGYIKGLSLYNSLGLTTQVSNAIQIGKREIRPSFKRGRFRISFIKQKNTINKENIPLLRLLDAIRYIKKIPDATADKGCIRLMALLRELKIEEKTKLVKLAYKYSPATRALLGSLLVSVGDVKENSIQNLKDSLNPITMYNFTISEMVLPNAKNWNIK
jgi:ABC-type lipopolysaccharide export system ATPase subunit